VLLLTARAALAWSAETGSFVLALSQAVRKAIVFGAVPLAVWAWVVSRRVRHSSGGDLDQVGPATNTDPDIATATSRRTGSGQA
jgi:hypothetical protein